MFVRTEFTPNVNLSTYSNRIVYKLAVPSTDGSGERIEILTDMRASGYFPRYMTHNQMKFRKDISMPELHSLGCKLAFVSWTVDKPRQQKKKKNA